jgi:hypothetical protein
MDPITYEAVHRNPELLEALHRQARRERAQEIHRLIIAPIQRLFTTDAAPPHFPVVTAAK